MGCSDLVYGLDLLLYEGSCRGHEDELGMREPAVVVVHHHGRDERLAYGASAGTNGRGVGWTFLLNGGERRKASIDPRSRTTVLEIWFA